MNIKSRVSREKIKKIILHKYVYKIIINKTRKFVTIYKHFVDGTSPRLLTQRH